MKRCALVLLFVCAPWAARADVDAFYSDRARDAAAALAAGDAHGAAQLYRIACFGMLDEPLRLAGCLGRRLIAEARADERDAFSEDFRRLASVEERFHGLERSGLSAAERDELAERAGALLTPLEVRLIPAIASAVEAKRREELEALPPKERIRRLERLAAEQPSEGSWRVDLVQAELDRGEPRAALERLQKIDAAERGPRTETLRGVALAQLGRCAESLTAFANGAPAASVPAAAAYVGCLHEAKRDAEARGFAAGLDPTLVAAEPVRKALAELAPVDVENVALEPPAESPSDSLTEGMTDPVEEVAPEADPSLPPLDEAERARVAAAREALTTTSTLADLERHIVALGPIARGRPDDAGVQRLLATLAYRASEWPLCVAAFDRSGSPAADPPLLRFYRSVCLLETGDRAGAAAALGDAAGALKRTPFVDRYLSLILGDGAPR